MFRRRLARYEMRDRIDPASAEPVFDIPLMSGACMLVQRKAIDATGGFDPDFFLYFEDYDWSVRLNAVTRSAYLPAMRVVHHGGARRAQGTAAHRVVRAQRGALLPQARLAMALTRAVGAGGARRAAPSANRGTRSREAVR